MELWSVEHLKTIPITFVILLAFSLLMRKLLINKSYEVRMIPVKIIAVIILVIEIVKQIVSASRGYNLYHLPLHFCSIFVYFLPIMAFYRGKGEKYLRSTTCAAMLALFIGMLIIPGVIYSPNRISTFFTDYLAFHTVVFHNIVILAFFLTLALELHKPRGDRREMLFVAIFGSVFVAIAATASHLLQTNFSNFLSSTIGFVADFVDELKLLIGDSVSSAVYTSVLAVLHVLLLVLTNYLFLLLARLVEYVSGKLKAKGKTKKSKE